MEASDLWVANGEGTEIIRAREIAAVSLDYNGNVTARLAGYNSTVVTRSRTERVWTRASSATSTARCFGPWLR